MDARLRTVLATALFFAVVSTLCAGDFSGEVVGVTDDDTIEVMREGKAEKVRLDGIDCPEAHQAYGGEARQFTSKEAFGKIVTVKVKEKDRYGRTVGEVILPSGKSLNRELVREGFAWWYREYAPDDKILERLESAARAAERGLWADAKPIPPWEFRKGRAEPDDATFKADLEKAKAEPDIARSGNELEELRAERDALKAALARKDAEIIRLRQQVKELSPPIGATAPEPSRTTGPSSPTTSEKTVTVYVTRTGEKYHRAGCQHLSKSRIPMSLEDAKAGGYTPCSLCKP